MKINFLFILLIIPYFLIIETTIASKSENNTDIKAWVDWDYLHNNAKIRNAFSFKEKALYNGLLFLPLLYKYRNNIWDILKPKKSRKHSSRMVIKEDNAEDVESSLMKSDMIVPHSKRRIQ